MWGWDVMGGIHMYNVYMYIYICIHSMAKMVTILQTLWVETLRS